MRKVISRINLHDQQPTLNGESINENNEPPESSIPRRFFLGKRLISNKRFAIPILLVISILIVGMFGFVPGVSAQTTLYTVKSTDTLGSIALAHRVTVQSLMAANPSIKNPNIVFAGETLTIPAPNLAPGESIWTGFRSTPVAATTPVPVTGGTTTYIVKANDTLGSIAFAHRVTVASLMSANPAITNPSIIFAGEQLIIPAPNLAPGESIWHGFTSATSSPTSAATAPAATATSPAATAPAATATSAAPTAQPTQSAMQSTQTGVPATGGQTVNVGETEFKLDMPTSVPAGMVTFNVTNNGTVPHSLEIQGQGIDQKLATILQPGQSGTLQVNLQPGTYSVFCPVDGHRSAGMMVTLTVQ